MDWQQPLALLIVGATAVAFLWNKTRGNRAVVAHETHCGCSTAQIGPRQSVTFRARKGERRQIVVRNG